MTLPRASATPPPTMKGPRDWNASPAERRKVVSPTYSGQKKIALPNLSARRAVVPGGTVDRITIVSPGNLATASSTFEMSTEPSGISTQITSRYYSRNAERIWGAVAEIVGNYLAGVFQLRDEVLTDVAAADDSNPVHCQYREG
jgi:hypothetical protein